MLRFGAGRCCTAGNILINQKISCYILEFIKYLSLGLGWGPWCPCSPSGSATDFKGSSNTYIFLELTNFEYLLQLLIMTINILQFYKFWARKIKIFKEVYLFFPFFFFLLLYLKRNTNKKHAIFGKGPTAIPQALAGQIWPAGPRLPAPVLKEGVSCRLRESFI